MLVAYVTADEVNQYVALQMADIRGVALHSFCFKGPRPDCRYDAVLYDLDSLSSERRQELDRSFQGGGPLAAARDEPKCDHLDEGVSHESTI